MLCDDSIFYIYYEYVKVEGLVRFIGLMAAVLVGYCHIVIFIPAPAVNSLV